MTNQKCENCIHNGICTRQRYWSNGFESDKDKIENCDAFLPDFTCKPQTNYDKITESVESLAEFLELTMDCSLCVVFDKYGCNAIKQMTCKECIIEWLQKECDEDDKE